jgi:hypothetical protein
LTAARSMTSLLFARLLRPSESEVLGSDISFHSWRSGYPAPALGVHGGSESSSDQS